MTSTEHLPLKLKEVEVYITNVCNLACPGCNRFNNYKFKGWQRWSGYEPIYREWAKQITFDRIGILGGEPLLNPDIMLWIEGLRSLWPSSRINIITNAYRLNQVKGLYEYLLAHKKVHLKVGIHNKKHRPFVLGEIEKFLTAPFTYKFDTENYYDQKLYITDVNNISILVEYNWWFHQGSLIPLPDTPGFTLYNSDVKKAHDNCSMKYCHTFHHGELYKCGVVALLPEFGEQHTIKLEPEDATLMHGYRPLQATDDMETKEKFINNLPNSIDQCKFCPEAYLGNQIWAEEKKVVFQR
jgi:organic radical activating enzyme